MEQIEIFWYVYTPYVCHTLVIKLFFLVLFWSLGGASYCVAQIWFLAHSSHMNNLGYLMLDIEYTILSWASAHAWVVAPQVRKTVIGTYMKEVPEWLN